MCWVKRCVIAGLSKSFGARGRESTSRRHLTMSKPGAEHSDGRHTGAQTHPRPSAPVLEQFPCDQRPAASLQSGWRLALQKLGTHQLRGPATRSVLVAISVESIDAAMAQLV